MKKLLPIAAAALMLGGASIESAAQSRYQEKKSKLDSLLTARYYRIPYDTNYVVRPEGRLTLKVTLNHTGNSILGDGKINGNYSKARLSTSHKSTMSIGASYRGISVSLALNPAKLYGAYKDYEFNLNYFSNRFSLDFSYQRSESLSGDIENSFGNIHLESGNITLNVVNLVGYYAFNHRRFSYPAAFTQSYIQRRSAGSWLAGISYQGGSIKTKEELIQTHPEALDEYLRIHHIGIGGGYGYNLVLGKKWLLHLSFLPTYVVYKNDKIEIAGHNIESQPVRLNMIFNERFAILHNFSPRYFVGAAGIINHSVFDDSSVTINQNKWRARLYFGMRL